jgi:predicted DNA-binding transcriptional regulator YafY
MNKLDRIYELLDLLKQHRYPVSARNLCEELECSHATLKRAMQKLRLEFNVPIIYKSKENGYSIDQSAKQGCELPGLWFSVSELHALLTINELLSQFGPGLLGAELKPFKDRITTLLEANSIEHRELTRRIRIHGVGIRHCKKNNKIFQKAADATLRRLRMTIEYQDRQADQWSKRTISPQRLLYYRSNWYLDCWCHLRSAYRIFALERIRSVRLLLTKAREIPEKELDKYHNASYGIFGGKADKTAVLRFTAKRARWIAEEQYHPEQLGHFLEDGSYELRLPYSDPRELLLDILRYGSDVEVLEPPDLRQQVYVMLCETVQQYQK